MKRPAWALGFVMLILGLLLTTQFRIQQQVPPDPSRLRNDELVAALKDRDAQLAAANKRVLELQREVEELRASANQISPVIPEENIELEMLAGAIEVTGPGVVVTLQTTAEATTAKNKVADEDIWRVMNELCTAGAEAISVNGVRVGPITGIRNVGNRILVNQTMIAAPVEIQAIGDPTTLEQALRLRNGVVDLLGLWGIQVKVSRNDALTLPALRSTPSIHYARPVEVKQ